MSKIIIFYGHGELCGEPNAENDDDDNDAADDHFSLSTNAAPNDKWVEVS